MSEFRDHNDLDDIDSLAEHDLVPGVAKLSKDAVEKTVEFLAKDMVDVLQSDLRFQDLVARLAGEHATYKYLDELVGTVAPVEDLQAELHTMVGTMLSQRIFALAATEMYFPQGGRD